jgi:hypothetical protein
MRVFGILIYSVITGFSTLLLCQDKTTQSDENKEPLQVQTPHTDVLCFPSSYYTPSLFGSTEEFRSDVFVELSVRFVL